MAASKLILLGTTLFRIPRPISSFFSSAAKLSISFRQSLNFRCLCSSVAVDTITDGSTKTLSPLDQRQLDPWSNSVSFLVGLKIKRRLIESSVAVDTITDGSTKTLSPLDQRQLHPWPEWVAFVDRLKTKGYLIESSPSPSPISSPGELEDDSDDATVATTGSVYMDMKLLKEACLSFARDRYDILKLLSIEDIQAVVQSGCPSLFRKVVNSAKRLRAQLQIDEGDVCSTCNLRGSCDRAYVILKDSEATARTVDIVRILLLYALDPLVVSGGEKPPGRDSIESSARRLLSELNEFSEAPLDPALPQPAARASPKSSDVKLQNDKFDRDVEKKIGDWTCPKCNFFNFWRNLQCKKCKEDGPRKTVAANVEIKKGDWICPECSFMNFSRNTRCLKCQAEGPKRIQPGSIEMKKGDWNCLQCEFMNFASNKKCLRCREPRPKRNLNPGEWECPSCDFLNYRRNVVCLKCNGERPQEELSNVYEEQLWRHPQV